MSLTGQLLGVLGGLLELQVDTIDEVLLGGDLRSGDLSGQEAPSYEPEDRPGEPSVAHPPPTARRPETQPSGPWWHTAQRRDKKARIASRAGSEANSSAERVAILAPRRSRTSRRSRVSSRLVSRSPCAGDAAIPTDEGPASVFETDAAPGGGADGAGCRFRPARGIGAAGSNAAGAGTRSPSKVPDGHYLPGPEAMEVLSASLMTQLGSPKRISCIIGDPLFKTQVLTLSDFPRSEQERRKVILWHIRKFLNYPIDSVRMDYAIIGRVPGSVKLLVTLCPAAEIQALEAAFAAGGGQVGYVGSSTIELFNLALAKGALPPGGNALIINRMPDYLSFLFAGKGPPGLFPVQGSRRRAGGRRTGRRTPSAGAQAHPGVRSREALEASSSSRSRYGAFPAAPFFRLKISSKRT